MREEKKPSHCDKNDTIVDDTLKKYEELRELAYADPVGTQHSIVTILSENIELGITVLSHSIDDRGSRFRQIAARAVKSHLKVPRVLKLLETWLEIETDEFAIATIRSVMYAKNYRKTPPQRVQHRDEVFKLEETYRYVTLRLRHRVLNALPGSTLSISRLKRRIAQTTSSDVALELNEMLDVLYDRLARLKFTVEFDEDRGHFQNAPINLIEWIKAFQGKFLSEYGGVEFSPVEFQSFADVWIVATPYWLEIIFSNLWKNSLDEMEGGPCRLANSVQTNEKHAFVTLYDNGQGFPESAKEWAFQIQHSTKSIERGRGLMEVAEALSKISGSASLFCTNDGIRVKLKFLRHKR